jgi:hypothetical protein
MAIEPIFPPLSGLLDFLLGCLLGLLLKGMQDDKPLPGPGEVKASEDVTTNLSPELPEAAPHVPGVRHAERRPQLLEDTQIRKQLGLLLQSQALD